MDKSFHSENRRALYSRLEKDSLVAAFSGQAPRRSADAYYPFSADRNFVYLTGILQNKSVFLGFPGEPDKEALFIPAPDGHAERWNGARIKADKAQEASGIADVRNESEFVTRLDQALLTGMYSIIYLPLYKHTADEPDSPAYGLVRYLTDRYPHIQIKDLMPHVRALRLIKKPCEIAAMREAEKDTGAGILAMMRAAKPGITESELKGIYEFALSQRGLINYVSTPIVSSGNNNFFIHYHDYVGTSKDGDMILNDVGACRDGIYTDVSRGWPVNGKYNDRQRTLYQCAYETSNHMFSIIKPGMPMGDVDATIRRFNFERLCDAGVCKNWEDIGTYMWHGGAHHVGYDVHDVVAITPTTPIRPGMVFCIDVGIYHEEWGIGFRLEDNCLVTENGCENLSRDIPRSVEDIEAAMK